MTRSSLASVLAVVVAATVGAMPALARADESPAEVSAWFGVGSGGRDVPETVAQLVEVTFGMDMTYRMLLIGGEYELRIGPFLNTAVSDVLAIGETGIELTFSEDGHAQWGTFDIRAGGGNGIVFGELTPHWVVTATGGIRSFANRFDSSQDLISFGSVFRSYGTLRLRPDSPHPWDISFGIEVEPTFLFPPYSLSKLMGANPR